MCFFCSLNSLTSQPAPYSVNLLFLLQLKDYGPMSARDMAVNEKKQDMVTYIDVG